MTAPMTDERAEEPLLGLRAQLSELDSTPVGTHPDTLEAVHRALVAELDALVTADPRPDT